MFFGFGFALFEVIFFLMFFLIMGVFVVMFVQNIRRWNKNNHSPRLSVHATVVAKREATTHHRNSSTHMAHYVTSYYVTFGVESGDRMELCMDGAEYGLLVEGDKGVLHFQGTRYLGFDRDA